MFPSKFLQFPSILTHFHAVNEKIQNGGRDLAISRGLVWVKILKIPEGVRFEFRILQLLWNLLPGWGNYWISKRCDDFNCQSCGFLYFMRSVSSMLLAFWKISQLSDFTRNSQVISCWNVFIYLYLLSHLPGANESDKYNGFFLHGKLLV